MRKAMVVLALLAAGCGGSSGDGTTTRPGTGLLPREDLVPARLFPRNPPLEVRVTMEEADLDELYARNPWSNDRLPAQVQVAGGEPIETRGLRFRGSTSRVYPKKNFNIRFDDPQPFLFGDDRSPGGTRFNLNAMWTDPTGMRERLNFLLYEELQAPAPDTYFANVWINEIFEGLYVNIERVDESLLARNELENRPGQFTLVRDRLDRYEPIEAQSTFGLDLDLLGADDAARIETLQEIFDHRGEAEEQDWAALLDLLRFTAETEAGPDFAEGFRSRFDLDNVLDVLAVHLLTQDRDSLDSDFWLHRSNDGGPWRMIPWDKNLTFGKNFFPDDGLGANDYFSYDLELLGTRQNRLFEKFMDTPELRDALAARTRELMERFPRSWFEERTYQMLGQMRPWLDSVQGPGRFERHPAQHFSEPGRTNEQVEALREFVDLRYQYLERALEAPGVDAVPYRATVRIEGAPAGERIFLTDDFGWVIAAVELGAPVQEATITAEVQARPGTDGIDRVWTVEVDGEPVAGTLSLYYRNLPPPFENWAPEREAVGRQDELRLARLGEGDAVEPLPSTVNPFVNRVQGAVELQSTQRFVLVFAP